MRKREKKTEKERGKESERAREKKMLHKLCPPTKYTEHKLDAFPSL